MTPSDTICSTSATDAHYSTGTVTAAETPPLQTKDNRKPARPVRTLAATCTPSSSSSEGQHADDSSSRSQDYAVDDYVSVQLGDNKSRRMLFVGQILEIDQSSGEFKVSFMKAASLRRESLYFWPEEKDISWENMSCITTKLKHPVVSSKSTNRRVLFSFQ